MTHCVLTMVMAVLLQPPATPAKEQPPARPLVPGQLGNYQFRVVNERFALDHPDIRIAEARVLEAQAALDQAKLKVAIESRMNQAKYDQAKADVATKTKEFERLDAVHKSGGVSAEEHAKVVAELQTAKRQLAILELLTQATREARSAPDRVTRVFDVSELIATPAQPLRELLDRRVKFAVRQGDTDTTVIGVLERSLKVWDFDAAKLIVRYPQATKATLKMPPVLHPVDGENSIGVWLLLMLDEFNGQQDLLPESMRGKYQIYVREYGLLFTLVKNAPDGAPTLAELLRQAKK